MKLHLPIALLTAVICAASAYGAGYNCTVSDDGSISGTYTGTSLSKGGILAVQDAGKSTAKDVSLTVGSTDGSKTSITGICMVGDRNTFASGNKTLTVQGENTSVYVIYGSNVYSREDIDNIVPQVTKDAAGNYPSITINIMDGAKVTQIQGGHSGPAPLFTDYFAYFDDPAYPQYYDKKLTDAPWALNEKVIINVHNATVSGTVTDGKPNPAILGVGYAGTSTNNSVEINITGEKSSIGQDVYAGAAGVNFAGHDMLAYSGSTLVNVTDAEVKGIIYASGKGGNGATATVNGDTYVELGGTATVEDVYAGGAGTYVTGNTKAVISGDEVTVNGTIYGGDATSVQNDRILGFHGTSVETMNEFIGTDKTVGFNAVEFKDVADIDFDDKKFNRFDTLYVAGSNPDKPTVVTTDAGRDFRKIHVQEGGQLDMGNAQGETSKYILTGTGVALEEALVVDGTMNVNNAHLVIQGTNSQLGIGYNSNNAVMNVVNSTVDMTGTSTVHMGYYNGKGGTLNIERGSKFIGGANNAWLGGGEINVVGGSSMEVCSTPQQYNYRTILGMSGNTLDLNIKDHSSFTSKATQFITNYNSDTTVNITVDGEGSILYQAGKTESKGSSYVIGTSGEWVTEEITKSDGTTTTVWRDKDTKGSVAGANKDDKGNPLPSDTITYIASAGTNAAGELYGTVNNAHTTITAKNGGKVQIDSARTYVGDVRDHATYGKDLNKSATFNVGKDSSMSFKKLDIYANTNVNFTESEGSAAGTFKTTGVNLNKGAQLNITGTAEHKGNFELNGGGMYIYGGVVNVNSANVDLSNGGTLSMGYYGEADSRLNITNGSDFKGASQNAWLGAGEVNVSGGSSLTVCTGNGKVNNYRVLMGLREDDLVESSTIALNVTEGSSFKSEASRFVTNYHSNTEVNITVDGEGSTFTQVAEARVVNDKNPDKHMEDTITYLLARGVDNNGELPYMPESSNDYRNGIVNNVSTTITATNGGKIDFQSSKTYIGFAKDKEVFDSDSRKEPMNKKATFNVGAGSSLSFKDVEVYANTVVNNNGGTFKAGNMNINNGGQLTFNVNTASAVMTAENLTVYTGGTLSFVRSAAAEGTSLAMEAPATTTVTLDSNLVLLAGSTLVLDPGMLVNLGYNDLTIQDGATIVLSNAATTTLTVTDDEVVAMATTLFQTAGTFTALDAAGNIKADGIANVTFNGSAVAISSGNGVANVPEPTTATLSLLALAGLCARRRRK